MTAILRRWSFRGYMLVIAYAAILFRIGHLLLTWKGGFK
jgi:hypothetical protein